MMYIGYKTIMENIIKELPFLLSTTTLSYVYCLDNTIAFKNYVIEMYHFISGRMK